MAREVKEKNGGSIADNTYPADLSNIDFAIYLVEGIEDELKNPWTYGKSRSEISERVIKLKHYLYTIRESPKVKDIWDLW